MQRGFSFFAVIIFLLTFLENTSLNGFPLPNAIIKIISNYVGREHTSKGLRNWNEVIKTPREKLGSQLSCSVCKNYSNFKSYVCLKIFVEFTELIIKYCFSSEK